MREEINPNEEVEQIQEFDSSQKPPINVGSQIQVYERQKENNQLTEERTTVDLVINQKSMKKFKAIIPSDHPTKKKKLSRAQKEREIINYVPNLGSKKSSASSLHRKKPPSQNKTAHEYIEENSQKQYSQGSKPGSRNSLGSYQHEEAYTDKPTSILQKKLNRHRGNSRRQIPMSKKTGNTSFNPHVGKVKLTNLRSSQSKNTREETSHSFYDS